MRRFFPRLVNFAFFPCARLIAHVSRRLYRDEVEALVAKIAREPARGWAISRLGIETLVSAEDHRFYEHPGVDAFAIGRAFVMTLLYRRLQGGSTIEQQLVRTLTGRFEIKPGRKIKEIFLAAALADRMGKDEIARGYIVHAYVGEPPKCSYQNAVSRSDWVRFIAMVKYPRPVVPNGRWIARIEKRERYIEKRLELFRRGGEGD